MSSFIAIAHVVRELRAAAATPTALPGAIRTFQQLIWDTDVWPVELSPSSAQMLRTLAYDLDYFEPRSAVRAESQAYYGFDRAVTEIREALAQIPEFDGAA